MRELIDIVTAPAGPGAGAAGGSVLAREISFVNSFVRDGNRERKRKRLGGGRISRQAKQKIPIPPPVSRYQYT